MTPEALAAFGYLIDANVLIDIIEKDSVWYDWSVAVLSSAARGFAVHINPLIYAEVSATFASMRDLDEVLPHSILKRTALPYSAGFLAAKAFAAYRRNGGIGRSPMPDFYIGAHAVVQNLVLVTRDARRYRTYFPTLRLIAPAT